MSDQDARLQEIAKKKVVYRMPGMDAVAVRQDETYRVTDDGALMMDLYGYTLDFDDSTAVADAAKLYGFANPCAGKSVDDLPSNVPLFLVRAGWEQFAGLNDALDHLVAKALARNLPVTLVNHHTGPHGFDLDDDSEISREIVSQILAFLRFSLGYLAK